MTNCLLSAVSHEMRTPLSTILGFTEMLMDESHGTLSDRQRRYLIHLQNAGRQLLDLANDISDLSKIQSGRMELYLGSVSVAGAIQDVLNTLRPQFAENSQQLVVDLNEDTPSYVRADPGRLRQILVSLLANAIRRSPMGSEIRISAGNRDGLIHLEIEAAVPGTAGAGLDLAIAEGLVKLHGGELRREGSRFLFGLPLAEHRGAEVQHALVSSC